MKIIEVPKEVIIQYPVDKIVERIVEVEKIVEVPKYIVTEVEKIVENVKVVYQDREVEVINTDDNFREDLDL